MTEVKLLSAATRITRKDVKLCLISVLSPISGRGDETQQELALSCYVEESSHIVPRTQVGSPRIFTGERTSLYSDGVFPG